LSPSEPPIDWNRIGSLPQLPREGMEPVFAEPWQAQAFALVIELNKRGYFTWSEWTQTLAMELQRGALSGDGDDGSRYYEHWLAALERLVLAKGLSDSHALLRRKSDWAEAYRHTPHGNPVVLPST
jgi:nitrile hydratase accessory protein